MSAAKGSTYERELVSHFRASGWGALRLPASGSATKDDLPDVLAGNGSALWAIEAKAGKATTLYVDAEEVEALERFAEPWGAKAYISGRFTTQGTPTEHYLLKPENARETPQGNFGIPVADVTERADVVVSDAGVDA